MYKSGGALGVQKLNSATTLIQRQPRRLLHAKYVLHRLGCSQENDQLLRDQVRQAMEKSNKKAYGRKKVLRFYDVRPDAKKEVAKAVCN
jgi:hypothetical protein